MDNHSIVTVSREQTEPHSARIGASEGVDFAATIKEMVDQVKALGPNQTKVQMVI